MLLVADVADDVLDHDNGSFDDPEDIFVPLNLVGPLQLHNNGNNSC